MLSSKEGIFRSRERVKGHVREKDPRDGSRLNRDPFAPLRNVDGPPKGDPVRTERSIGDRVFLTRYVFFVRFLFFLKARFERFNEARNTRIDGDPGPPPSRLPRRKTFRKKDAEMRRVEDRTIDRESVIDGI